LTNALISSTYPLQAGLILCCLGCAIFGVTEVSTDGIDFENTDFDYTNVEQGGGLSPPPSTTAATAAVGDNTTTTTNMFDSRSSTNIPTTAISASTPGLPSQTGYTAPIPTVTQPTNVQESEVALHLSPTSANAKIAPDTTNSNMTERTPQQQLPYQTASNPTGNLDKTTIEQKVQLDNDCPDDELLDCEVHDLD
jgi:hypothetical protein